MPGIILSCGIHGDETGPIRLLQSIQNQLDHSTLNPVRPLLLIYGNLDAIELNKRYIQQNMNRLFSHDLEVTDAESNRAYQLIQACSRFADTVKTVACHLDLHSTIKPSLHDQFALQPATAQPYRYHWSNFFQNAHISAWVHQAHSADTFSQYSHTQFQCDSFTLECGSNAHSKKTSLASLEATIGKLISSTDVTAHNITRIPPTMHPHLIHYDVVHAITKSSTDFDFLIDEHEANFSTHPAGTPIYRNNNTDFITQEYVATLFLNKGVEVGQRAGLLLKPRNVSS